MHLCWELAIVPPQYFLFATFAFALLVFEVDLIQVVGYQRFDETFYCRILIEIHGYSKKVSKFLLMLQFASWETPFEHAKCSHE